MDIETFAAKFLIEVLVRWEDQNRDFREEDLIELIDRAYRYAETYYRESKKHRWS